MDGWSKQQQKILGAFYSTFSIQIFLTLDEKKAAARGEKKASEREKR
jgi:hypothetical protein